jgi:hypothetical protein
MKQLKKYRVNILIIISFLVTTISVSGQDTAAAEPAVKLRYFIKNNTFPYLIVQSGLKVGKKFQPLPKQAVKLFLDSNRTENLLMKTYTDENGKAKIIIPPALQDQWRNSPKHNFIAVLESSSAEDERTTELEITKAKIEIDTSSADGVRTVTVKVMYLENNDWVPAKDVEMKIGISRQASILSAGDEETYTTDSAGTVSAEFKKDSLPGDQQGNIVLAAKVEDNDLYGNLLVEKTVHWGVAVSPEKNFFDQRTLWSTRFKTPFWLLFMAYAIVIGVWGTIIYLVAQIVKINKLGKASN